LVIYLRLLLFAHERLYFTGYLTGNVTD